MNENWYCSFMTYLTHTYVTEMVHQLQKIQLPFNTYPLIVTGLKAPTN